MKDIGRNDLCPCGSSKKYKKCCLPQLQQVSTSTMVEKQFIAELRPEINEAVDAALAQMECGQLKTGKREIEGLFDKHPDYYMTNYAMGVLIAHFEERPVEAIPYFESAVQTFPIFGSAYYNLGGCYLKAAEIEKAITAYRSARKYAEDEEVSDRAEKQLSFIEQTVKTPLIPNLDAYLKNAALFAQAYTALQSHRFEQAIFLFQKVLEKEPRCVQAFGNIALAYAFVGRKALAMNNIDRALALDPNYEPAIVNKVAISKMEEGQPATPSQIHETRYYADYRSKKKGTYLQGIAQNRG